MFFDNNVFTTHYCTARVFTQLVAFGIGAAQTEPNAICLILIILSCGTPLKNLTQSLVSLNIEFYSLTDMSSLQVKKTQMLWIEDGKQSSWKEGEM